MASYNCNVSVGDIILDNDGFVGKVTNVNNSSRTVSVSITFPSSYKNPKYKIGSGSYKTLSRGQTVSLSNGDKIYVKADGATSGGTSGFEGSYTFKSRNAYGNATPDRKEFRWYGNPLSSTKMGCAMAGNFPLTGIKNSNAKAQKYCTNANQVLQCIQGKPGAPSDLRASDITDWSGIFIGEWEKVPGTISGALNNWSAKFSLTVSWKRAGTSGSATSYSDSSKTIRFTKESEPDPPPEPDPEPTPPKPDPVDPSLAGIQVFDNNVLHRLVTSDTTSSATAPAYYKPTENRVLLSIEPSKPPNFVGWKITYTCKNRTTGRIVANGPQPFSLSGPGIWDCYFKVKYLETRYGEPEAWATIEFVDTTPAEIQLYDTFQGKIAINGTYEVPRNVKVTWDEDRTKFTYRVSNTTFTPVGTNNTSSYNISNGSLLTQYGTYTITVTCTNTNNTSITAEQTATIIIKDVTPPPKPKIIDKVNSSIVYTETIQLFLGPQYPTNDTLPSGCEIETFTVNGQSVSPGTEFNTTGIYTVNLTIKKSTNGMTASAIGKFEIDNTPPEPPTIVVNNTDKYKGQDFGKVGTFANPINISYLTEGTGTTLNVRIYYKNDYRNPWRLISSSINPTTLSDKGYYYIKANTYKPRNRLNSDVTAIIVVKKIKYTWQIVLNPNTLCYRTFATILFNNDPTLKKQYKIDNGEWKWYREPIPIYKNCTIYARSLDGDDDFESNITSKVVDIIDTNPPENPIIIDVEEGGIYEVAIPHLGNNNTPTPNPPTPPPTPQYPVVDPAHSNIFNVRFTSDKDVNINSIDLNNMSTNVYYNPNGNSTLNDIMNKANPPSNPDNTMIKVNANSLRSDRLLVTVSDIDSNLNKSQSKIALIQFNRDTDNDRKFRIRNFECYFNNILVLSEIDMSCTGLEVNSLSFFLYKNPNTTKPYKLRVTYNIGGTSPLYEKDITNVK